MAAREVGPAEYLLVGMGSLAYTCYTFIWFSLPAFLSSVIDQLGLSTTGAGVLVGAIPLVYVPLGLASGLLIDRVGSRGAIGVALCTFGAAQVARAFAGDFVSLLVPTLLMGVAGTGITFGLPKLVSELFPPERTGTMSSVYQIGSQLGPAAAFGLARPVLGPSLGGWRAVFLASGLAVLGYAAVWLVVAAGYGRRRGMGVLEAADADDDDDDERAFTLASARRDVARLFAHRDMLLLVAVGTAYLFVTHGLRGWLAVILEVRGFAPELAGVVTSLLILGQVSGTLTVPPLSDRWGRRRPLLAACGGLCAVGTLGLLAGAATLPAVIVVVWAAGMGLGGLSPMIKVIPIEIDGIGPRLTATAMGFVYAVGEIGGFGGPVVLGALRDLTGSFAVGLGALVAASLVVVAASASMRDVA